MTSIAHLGSSDVHHPIPSPTDLLETLTTCLGPGDVRASRRHPEHRDPTKPVPARPALLEATLQDLENSRELPTLLVQLISQELVLQVQSIVLVLGVVD